MTPETRARLERLRNDGQTTLFEATLIQALLELDNDIRGLNARPQPVTDAVARR